MRQSEWRVTLRASNGDRIAVIVFADDVSRAEAEARKKCPLAWTVVNVTTRCSGTSASGKPCTRWTTTGRCRSHGGGA